MTSKFLRLVLVAAAASSLALPAFAQSAEWRVDGNHSSAHITVETQPRDTRDSVTLAAAAASGVLRIDAVNPANSALEIDLAPAGAQSGLSTGGPILATHLTFRSQKAALTPDGKLKLTGKLTVSHIIREIHGDANEAYSGPIETSRVIFQTTREESLVLGLPEASRDGRTNPSTEVSTSLRVSAEDFPELLNGNLAANWPAVAQDGNCDYSTSASEGYSGAVCTGSAVESRSIRRAPEFASESYSGDDAYSASPASIITVALHLRLQQQGVQVSARTGQ